jgi:hypothetical protein
MDDETTDDHFLNDTWHVFFHDPLDDDWTNQSYKNLNSISSIEEAHAHLEAQKPIIHKGMFFIMRDGVFPCWDDPENIKGGSLSIKVLKESVYTFWEKIVMQILGESFLIDEKTEYWNYINGVSISPKKYFCIIKVWLKDELLFNKEFYKIGQDYTGEVVFKLNIDNIQSQIKS